MDLSKWQVNANKGAPRVQTASKQEEIRKQIDKMSPNKVAQISQAEHYSRDDPTCSANSNRMEVLRRFQSTKSGFSWNELANTKYSPNAKKIR